MRHYWEHDSHVDITTVTFTDNIFLCVLYLLINYLHQLLTHTDLIPRIKAIINTMYRFLIHENGARCPQVFSSYNLYIWYFMFAVNVVKVALELFLY